jgi:hypothetical protein
VSGWHKAIAGGLGALAMGAMGMGSACDKSPFESDRPIAQPPEQAPPRAREQGAAPDPDSGIVLEHADPPAPAGDLKEDVERFTTLDTCVSQHALADPLVGDALRSIGYDTFLRDACRVLQALKMKDSAPCEAISSTALQRHCQGLLAMAETAPDKCPWYAVAEKRDGRDPTCLAVSTHDPRDCAAENASLGPLCQALASGDVSHCGQATGDERATCSRDVEREKTLLAEAEVHDVHDRTTPKVHFEVHGAKGTKDPAVTEADLSANFAGGVVISAASAGGVAVVLARDPEEVLGLPLRSEKTHVVAEVAMEKATTVTKLAVNVPRMPEVVCPSPHCDLTVTMVKADPKRGTPLSATIEGTVEVPSGTYEIKLQIDSFVRDVVSRAALFGGR